MKTRNLNSERAYARRRYQRLVLAGLCCQCAQTVPVPGFRRCEKCRDANREAARKHVAKQRRAWRHLGVCITCGQREAMPQRSQCGACADHRDELHAKRKAARA